MLVVFIAFLVASAPFSLAGQTGPEAAVGVFHRDALEPANGALDAKDTMTARRLVPTVTRAFQALGPPVLRAAQATNVQRLARRYMEMLLFDEAVALLDAAAAALELTAPVTNDPLALVLADAARAHRLTGRSREAESLLNRAQRLLGPTAQANSDMFPIYVEQAELRRARGDLAGAENLLRPLIAAADRMGGWQYVPNLVGLFDAYAALLNQRGDSDTAATFLSRAETVRKNTAVAEAQIRRLLEGR